MAAAAYFDTVQKIFIAFYQRPADPAGLKYWADRIDAANGDAAAVVSAFATSPEAVTLYGPIDATTIGTVIDKIYLALFNAAPDAAGKKFYVDGFTSGKFTAGTIALNILNGAANDDAVAIANKLQVSNNFTQQVDGRALTSPYFGTGSSFNATYKGDADAQAARDILKTVTASPSTVLSPSQVTEQIQTKIADAGDAIIGQTGGQTFTLTTGIDTLTGSAGNDTFNAPISDSGTPTPTLGGLDTIDGGAGTDTLSVDFGTAVAALPGTVTIKNIEVLKVGTSTTTAGGSTLDASSIAGLQTINFSNAGNQNATVKAGSAATVTATGGVNASVEGKAITNVTVTKATGTVNVDNLNATTGVTSTGTTLTSVTLDGVASAATLKGDALNTVTVKNVVGAGVAQAVTVTNAVSKDITVNVDNVGYKIDGTVSTGATTVAAGSKAENITVNATGAKSTVTVTAAAAKNLTITGTADLALAGVAGAALKSIDGSAATGGLTLGVLNAGTANVKTGSGNDTFTINAAKATVDSGAGNDTVTIGSTLIVGSSINLGAGDDILQGAALKVSAADLTGTVAIDGGAGIDTVAASLINVTNAKQFVNFERIDASIGTNNLDVELMTGSTISGVSLNGDGAGGSANGTVTLQNLAAGAGLTIAGQNTGSLTIGVKGAAANVADSFNITFAGQALPGATAGSQTAVSATKVGLQGVETVNVASGGTGFVANTLSLNSNTELKTVAITGDKALTFTLATAAADTTFGGTTAGKGVSSFDGSAATGKLTLDFSGVVTAATAGVDVILNIAAGGLTIKGGSADDTIKVGAFSSTLAGGAGKDLFDVSEAVVLTGATAAATAVKTTITDFAAGDTIDLTIDSTVVTTLAKVTLTAGVQNLDDALNLVGATTKTVSWFNYGADTYVVYNADASAGIGAGDALVKLTGTIDLSNATVDTNGVLALA